MIKITADTYLLAAEKLKEKFAAEEWFNGSVEGETPDIAVDPARKGAHGETETGVSAETAIETADRAVARAEWKLTLSAIIYRRTEIFPEGTRRPVADVVPVWWEFSTAIAEEGPVANDFSFNELKSYLIDHD